MEDIKKYLDEASTHAGDYKARMGILETKAPERLNAILADPEYWRLSYNSEKEDYIIKTLGLELSEEERHQLGGFVYLHNCKRREEEEAAKIRSILSLGYIEINPHMPSLDKLKVKGFFKITRTGIMGSSEALEQMEGTLVYAKHLNSLLLIPKGRRTRGILFRDCAYVKKEG